MSQSPPDPLADTWSADSYAPLAKQYLPMAARLVDGAGIATGDVVLDVGCGTGNVAITAAHRGATVTGLDLTPGMIDYARERAHSLGVDDVEWREGSAMDLPYDANAFDATVSALGHMYAQPPGDAAEELLRVTETGGTVAFTAWTPTTVFPTIAGYVAAALPADSRPDFASPPFAWGDPSVVRDRLEGGVTELSVETETIDYPAVTPAAFWEDQLEHSDVFSTFLEDVEDKGAVREQVLGAIEPYHLASENVVELEYLRTTATVAPEI